jgi:hypothetical protein
MSPRPDIETIATHSLKTILSALHANLTREIMAIWTQLKDQNVFGENMLREHSMRVMARCVAYVMEPENGIAAYQEVLKMVRVQPHGTLDGMVCSAFARHLEGYKEEIVGGERDVEGDFSFGSD